MKVVAFVPIKLNSQRLPHKNILPIAGHPLCWHLCNTLLKVNNIDEVYVYCSDERVSDYIPEGVILKKRDKKLDGDLVKGFDIYRSFISEVDADVYVLAFSNSSISSEVNLGMLLNPSGLWVEYLPAFNCLTNKSTSGWL